jgi:hypothetical protein
MSEQQTIFTLREICQKDNIEFWTQQFSEHALFIYLGIVDVNEDTKAIRKKAHDFYLFFKNINIRYSQSNEREKNRIRDTLKDEVEKLGSFKRSVLRQIKNEWSGWLYPEFITHILHELQFFLKREYNTINDGDIVRFWNEINSEHADFTAHLLDPTERELIDEAFEFEKKFYKLNKKDEEHHNGLDILQFTLLSQHLSKEMDEFTSSGQEGIHNGSILSVIHPLLIDHVKREGQRSICELKEIIHKLEA